MHYYYTPFPRKFQPFIHIYVKLKQIQHTIFVGLHKGFETGAFGAADSRDGKAGEFL